MWKLRELTMRPGGVEDYKSMIKSFKEFHQKAVMDIAKNNVENLVCKECVRA
ncbi:unnamed protein product [Rhodiola kirilowii]